MRYSGEYVLNSAYSGSYGNSVLLIGFYHSITQAQPPQANHSVDSVSHGSRDYVCTTPTYDILDPTRESVALEFAFVLHIVCPVWSQV